MNTLKNKISTFLAKEGSTFENSKEALNAFEKQTGDVSSIIYFSRVFALHKADVKKTKKDKVAEFIRKGGFKNCEDAHTKYTATGQDVSLIYFSRVYTAVRKEKAPTATKKVKIEVITISNLTAKQILLKVQEKAGQAIKLDVKDKKGIVAKATSILTTKGFKVN